MDIPLDVGACGRSSLQTNWIFYNFPIAYADLSGSGFTTGKPGVSVDNRTSGQPQYSNNVSLGGLLDSGFAGAGSDNTALAASNTPGLFIANKSGSALTNFIRLFSGDITDANVGVFLQKIVTSEDCANPTAYRWFLCSQLLIPS
jgi:hypothetical protein